MSRILAADSVVRTIGGVSVRRDSASKAFYWTNTLHVDADGAADAYNAANTGIDYLANAGRPGNWWGITTDSSGTPYKQGSNDPKPGYYVSGTSLVNKIYPSSRQCRFVESRKISYIVIPNISSFRSAVGVKIGDFGLLYYKKTGKMLYTMYADAGPSNKIGEGSIYAIEAIGHNPWNSARTRVVSGVPSGVTIVMFPNTGFGNGYIPTNNDINQHAKAAFKAFGGCARLERIVGSISGCSLDAPLIRDNLNYQCGQAGVGTACSSGRGQCASATTCGAWGGDLLFGTSECKPYPGNVACCSKNAASLGDSAPPPPAASTNPTPPPAPVSIPSVSNPNGKTGVGALCVGSIGRCQDTTVHSCGVPRVSNKCAGDATVKCCPTAGLTTEIVAEPPRASPLPVDNPNNKFGVGALCSGVAGRCQDTTVHTCLVPRVTRKCLGGNDVVCCPLDGLPTGPVSSPGAPSSEPTAAPTSGGNANDGGLCGGLQFPVGSDSLTEISVNFGQRRSNNQCHAAVDVYTRGQHQVSAVGQGRVVALIRGSVECSGGEADDILVLHSDGPLANQVVNYGNIDPGSYQITVGSTVQVGQAIGTSSRCGQLHFELLEGSVRSKLSWPGPCDFNALPNGVLDPRPLLECLAPANVRYRHGVSFLEDDFDESSFVADLEQEKLASSNGDNNSDDSAMTAGVIAAIVICTALCLMALAGVVVFLVMRRSSSSLPPIHVVNEMQTAYETGAPTYDTAPQNGEFQCQECGKVYDFAEDLSEHFALRH
eukprot:CAMPEP_0168591400 /NCGR_PEP_ID=MMETSP0420-20121227/7115_1 /TAXON_ID=498008 /ORGANISM="Pessonella sp." /LENGTH=768 /DNA_ID=CAMNT_0008627191 /DNA_START=87 /DNA_END=2393 /DNA_ORIENTATION=+